MRLFTEHPDLDEGCAREASRRRRVDRRAGRDVARRIGLGEHLLLGRGEDLTGGRDKDSILADTMEAIIGATYLSVGPDAATALVLRLVEPLLRRPRALRRGDGPQDEPAGARGAAQVAPPDVRGRLDRPRPRSPLHRDRDGRRDRRPTGTGTSKKHAEMAAALAAWRELSGRA